MWPLEYMVYINFGKWFRTDFKTQYLLWIVANNSRNSVFDIASIVLENRLVAIILSAFFSILPLISLHSFFFIRISFFRLRLNFLIFLPILGWKYSCEYQYFCYRIRERTNFIRFSKRHNFIIFSFCFQIFNRAFRGKALKSRCL